MTRRLLVSYLGLALLVLALLEAPLAVLASRYEGDQAATQAQRVATGLAIAAGEDFEHHRLGDLQAVVRRYRQQTGGEVEIVDSNGAVVAHFDPDHDNDASGAKHRFVLAALTGRSVATVTDDEDQPQAVAAVPIGESAHSSGAILLALPTSTTLGRLHELWLGLAAIDLVVLALTLGIGLWMARSLARPLLRLQDTVDALGKTDLAARAEVDDGPPEIRALARQFNQMAGRLAELVDAQASFVADASHQLRSPLTALRLRLENLEAHSSGSSADTVAAAGREVQRLSRLVDGLLKLGQAERHRSQRRPVDIGEVIDERCQAWAALAAERQIELDRQIEREPAGPRTRRLIALVVPGDLEQILDNLLANALDASPPGSKIVARVSAGGRAPKVAIHIVDKGPGMTEIERRHAFDRFWQGPGAQGGHSGLGLAIVRQIAIRNQIEVDLRPAGGGGLDAVVELQLVGDSTERRTPSLATQHARGDQRLSGPAGRPDITA